MGLLWIVLLPIPVLGVLLASINLNGWLLATLDNLRTGSRTLPEPGLHHLRRGVRLFLVELVYFGVLVLAGAMLLGAGVLLSLQRDAAGGAPWVVPGLLLSVFGQSVLLVGSTLWVAATPAIVVLTERQGPAAALDVRRVVAGLRARPRAAVVGGLLALLSLDVIAPAGVLLCVVGLVLTVPYAYAVLAAAVEWYERTEQEALRR